VLRLALKLPRRVAVATSGGPDSMAALDFMQRRREVTVLHFNHGTPHAAEAAKFVRDYCSYTRIPAVFGEADTELKTEEEFRDARLAFFREARCAGHGPVVTGHHLDDAVEWWIMTALRGNPLLMPVSGISSKPFILNSREEMHSWLTRNGVPFVTDPSNKDVGYSRNFVRHEIVPRALVVSPGLRKVIKKKYLEAPPRSAE
jgi:tRNA(Ile)-lysidine synthase